MDKTRKRIDADDLPSGGAYAIVQFRAADGAPVEESQATQLEIIEYSAQDKPLQVTFIELVGEEPNDVL